MRVFILTVIACAEAQAGSPPAARAEPTSLRGDAGVLTQILGEHGWQNPMDTDARVDLGSLLIPGEDGSYSVVLGCVPSLMEELELHATGTLSHRLEAGVMLPREEFAVKVGSEPAYLAHYLNLKERGLLRVPSEEDLTPACQSKLVVERSSGKVASEPLIVTRVLLAGRLWYITAGARIDGTTDPGVVIGYRASPMTQDAPVR